MAFEQETHFLESSMYRYINPLRLQLIGPKRELEIEVRNYIWTIDDNLGYFRLEGLNVTH